MLSTDRYAAVVKTDSVVAQSINIGQQEDLQPADELALLRKAYAVDLLSDMLDVGLGELAGAQEFGLLAAPGVEIAIVQRALQGQA